MLDTPTVDVPIPLDPEIAAKLDNPALRTAAGLLIANWLRPPDHTRLFAAMDALAAEAARRGLTDEILEAELAAHKAERRNQPRRA